MMNLPKSFPRLALAALTVLVMQADSPALTAHGAVNAGLPPPPVARIHPVTGNAVVSVALPLRHVAEDSLHRLADAVSRLHLAVVPTGDALLSAQGLPADTVRIETLEFGARSRDVWIEAPLYAGSQLNWAATDYFLHVRQPGLLERSFDLELAPPPLR